MSFILTLISVISVIFTLISLGVGLYVVIRLSGKLKSAIFYLLIVLFILLARGLIRLTSMGNITAISASDLDTINILMNLAITFFTLISTLEFRKMIKVIDHKSKK